MKILQIHHRYSSAVASGEDRVVVAEAELLRKANHEVVGLARDWDAYTAAGPLGLVRAALSSVWNPTAVRQVERACIQARPEIVHVHNTFPSFSPAIFWPAHRHVPTVFTVHNFRAFCAAAVASRNGSPCFECIESHSVMPAMRYGCYRKSRLATLAPAAMIATHRMVQTWERNIDAFIALNSFQRGVMVRSGWPEDRIHIKPNFCADPGQPRPWVERDPVVVFAGRLSPEKGAHVLVEAWRLWGASSPELHILGEGPEGDKLQILARNGPAESRIKFLGHVSADTVHREIAKARLVVIPSIWSEGFPIILAESYAAGTPVVVSDFGALAELVEEGVTGVRFAIGLAPALYKSVSSLWSANGRLAKMGAAARMRYEADYAPEANLKQLVRIYQAATERHHKSAPDAAQSLLPPTS